MRLKLGTCSGSSHGAGSAGCSGGARLRASSLATAAPLADGPGVRVVSSASGTPTSDSATIVGADPAQSRAERILCRAGKTEMARRMAVEIILYCRSRPACPGQVGELWIMEY
jgi:hypothetical protein